MALSDIFDAIEAEFVDTQARALGLSGRVPNFGSGEAAITDIDAVPRVIFVPRGGHVERTKGNGPAPVMVDDVLAKPNPRPLFDRHMVIDAHVTGETVDDAEALCNHVAAAAYAAVGAVVIAEAWPKAEATTTDGVLCVISIEVKGLQYTRVPDQTVTVVETEIAPEVQA